MHKRPKEKETTPVKRALKEPTPSAVRHSGYATIALLISTVNDAVHHRCELPTYYCVHKCRFFADTPTSVLYQKHSYLREHGSRSSLHTRGHGTLSDAVRHGSRVECPGRIVMQPTDGGRATTSHRLRQ